MRLLNRYLRRAGIPHLALWIIALQVCGYVCLHVPMRGLNQAEIVDRMLLIPDQVFAGEWWRLLTFICFPPCGSLIFAILGWWFFYLMGTYLESYWGVLRFNLYLGIWWAATVGVALLTGQPPIGNFYLIQSVFLAFAFLLPDFVIQIYFVLPIQVKWVAWFNWLWIFYAFGVGDWSTRASLVAAVANFLIFFWREIPATFSHNRRRILWQARYHQPPPKYRHKCIICGATDKTHPDAEFRYCSQCAGTACYCDAHLPGHTHISAEDASVDSRST